MSFHLKELNQHPGRLIEHYLGEKFLIQKFQWTVQ